MRFPLESVAKVRTFWTSANMLQNIFRDFLKLIAKLLIIGTIQKDKFQRVNKLHLEIHLYIYAHARKEPVVVCENLITLYKSILKQMTIFLHYTISEEYFALLFELKGQKVT